MEWLLARNADVKNYTRRCRNLAPNDISFSVFDRMEAFQSVLQMYYSSVSRPICITVFPSLKIVTWLMPTLSSSYCLLQSIGDWNSDDYSAIPHNSTTVTPNRISQNIKWHESLWLFFFLFYFFLHTSRATWSCWTDSREEEVLLPTDNQDHFNDWEGRCEWDASQTPRPFHSVW